MATETLTIDGVFRDLISNQVKRVAGSFKTLGFTSDSVFKGLLKFGTAEKVFEGIRKVAGVVWKDVLASSPLVQKQVDEIKQKISVLVGTLTQNLIPVFSATFKFLLDNWNEIRFAFSVGIAVIKDAFNGLLGAFQMMASGFFVALGGIASALSKFGLVSKETVEGFNKSAEDLAAKAVGSFSKVGASVDVLKGGIAGLGKEVKATYDIFGDKKKLTDAQKAIEENNEKVSEKAEAMAKKSKAIIERQLADEREMIEQEAEIKKGILEKISQDKIAVLEFQSGKELEVLDLKQKAETEAFNSQAGMSLLSETEKQEGLLAIDQKYAEQRKLVQADADKTILEQKQVFLDNLSSSTATLLGGVAAISQQQADEEIKRNEKDANKKIALVRKQVKSKIISEEEGEKAISDIQDSLAKKNKEAAALSKKIAMGEAMINTSLAVTKALAQGGIFGTAAAVGIGLLGAAQVAKINAQEFERGGIIGGKRHSQGGTLIEAELGESILTRDATRRIGAEGVTYLNNGGSLSNNLSFGGNTIIINGNADPTVVKRAVDQSYAEKIREAQALLAGAKRRGVKV